MHIAYIIIAYKNFHQVERLIKRLSDPGSVFILVVDSKTPAIDFEAFRQRVAVNPRVKFAPRHSIQWGGFSLTYANIVGLRALIQSGASFDYVFSMSGQDYPLVRPAEICRALSDARGKSILEYEPLPVEKWIDGGMGRIYSWNFFLPGRRVIQIPKATRPENAIVRSIYGILGTVIPRRGPLPGGMKPFGGSMHWTLSREAAEYVCSFIERHPEYVRRFRFTRVSDELFFQTILGNSPLRDMLINDDQRYLRWPELHAPSPVILTMGDLPVLRTCGKLFARKFDMTLDAEVLDAIDEDADRTAVC